MKNRSMVNENNCGSEQWSTLASLWSTIDTTVAVAGVDFLHPHRHQHTQPGVCGHVHRCCRLHGQENQIRSFSNVTISSIVEVTLEKQQYAPGSAALELQRSSAPCAPDQNNVATRFGPNDDEWKSLQRNEFEGKCHNNT